MKGVKRGPYIGTVVQRKFDDDINLDDEQIARMLMVR